MYRFMVLCALVAVAVSVTADDAVNTYVRRARSPYTYGEDNHGDHGGHGHGGSDGQQASLSSGKSNFEPNQATGSSSGHNTQPLLGQDGHGQQGYQGHNHGHGHDHGQDHGHDHGHGNDNYLYKQHGY